MTIKENDNYFIGRSSLGAKVKEFTVTFAAEAISITAAQLGFTTLKQVSPIVKVGSAFVFLGIDDNVIKRFDINTDNPVVDATTISGAATFTVTGL